MNKGRAHFFNLLSRFQTGAIPCACCRDGSDREGEYEGAELEGSGHWMRRRAGAREDEDGSVGSSGSGDKIKSRSYAGTGSGKG